MEEFQGHGSHDTAIVFESQVTFAYPYKSNSLAENLSTFLQVYMFYVHVYVNFSSEIDKFAGFD